MAVILGGDTGSAVVQPVKAVCREIAGESSYDLIVGRAVLDLGMLTVGSGRFSFRISPGHHEPVHG